MTRWALHAQLTSAVHALIHLIRDEEGSRRVSEISVLIRDPASGLVRAERAVHFLGDGRAVRGPGGAQLERLLDR